MSTREPHDLSFGSSESRLASKQELGTSTGTANCGIDGGSSRRKPSTIISIAKVYFWSARYTGLCCPANCMVVLMAERASVTV